MVVFKAASAAMDISIEPLKSPRDAELVDLFALAFIDSPVFVAVFGEDERRRRELLTRYFRLGVELMRGTIVVATHGGAIVGALHYKDSPGCFVSGRRRASMLPAVLVNFGTAAPRLGRLMAAWAKADPTIAHSHGGPLGVHPDHRGQGIGDRLMRHWCEDLDGRDRLGYFETDATWKVEFHRRFGFEVFDELRVLGVTNWLMRRHPRRPDRRG